MAWKKLKDILGKQEVPSPDIMPDLMPPQPAATPLMHLPGIKSDKQRQAAAIAEKMKKKRAGMGL
jgi:hypothetical protein